MAAYVIVGTLAAFGLLCALWTAFGWLLSGGKGGYIVCPDLSGSEGRGFVRRCLWLKGLWLLKCPVYVADKGISQKEREKLESAGIEFLCPDSGLGIGAEGN